MIQLNEINKSDYIDSFKVELFKNESDSYVKIFQQISNTVQLENIDILGTHNCGNTCCESLKRCIEFQDLYVVVIITR